MKKNKLIPYIKGTKMTLEKKILVERTSQEVEQKWNKNRQVTKTGNTAVVDKNQIQSYSSIAGERKDGVE